MKNRAKVWLAAALAAALAGCGGGGADSTERTPTDATPSTPAPAAGTTLPAYVAKRAERVTVQGFPAPSPHERSWLADGSQARALAQLSTAWAHLESNALALPPLEAAFAESVAAAARGNTLAQLRQAYPAAPGPYAASVQTQGIERSLWAPAGTRFDEAFLLATDAVGPLPALSAWSATEVRNWTTDLRLPALFDGLLANPRDALSLSLNADTRLLLVNHQVERLPLPKAESFIGVYQGAGDRLQGPMLRFTSGVVHHGGGDFAAAAMPIGDRWLVTLQPTQAGLAAFTAARLQSALAETVQTVTARTLVALPAGDMVLPQSAVGFTTSTAELQRIPLAAAERQADLRGLDGGGTFVRAAEPRGMLRIDSTGLRIEGGHVLAFNFTTLNPYSDGNYGGAVLTQVTFDIDWPATCADKVDLRPFFLAVLDADKRVVALAAVARLDSEPFKRCY